MNTMTRSALLTLLLSAASPAHAAKYKITWLIGHPNLDYFEQAAASFKAAVESGSGGEIEVAIVPAKSVWEDSSQGRATPEIADRVAKGEAEMGHSFTNIMGQLDHRLWVFDLPYLFTGYRHLESVIEGPLGPELLAGLRSRDMVGLAFTYSGGAQGLTTREREIRGPRDLSGLKVGVFGSAVDKAWLEGLGAVPVPIEHRLDRVRTLSRAGEMDAAVLTWRRLHEGRVHEQYKYVNMMHATHLVSVTYINAKYFDGLPEKFRALIQAAATTAARLERAQTIELNETAMREMSGRGMHPIYLSEAGRQGFQEALRPIYARTLDGIVGKDLIERIRRTGESAPHPSDIKVAQR